MIETKRHKCIICNQKRAEDQMVKIIHTGKNGVAYSGWICKLGSYRTASKNYDNYYGSRKECEPEFRRREEAKKNVDV